MLVMALEAANQLLSDKAPKAFVFENVEFVGPILLGDAPAGTEVEICFTPVQADKGSSQYRFRIATWKRDGSCDEVCHGSISADYGRVVSEVDYEDEAGVTSPWANLKKAEASCVNIVKDFYSECREKCGADFGPTFQRLRDVYYNTEGEVIATLSPLEGGCIVHPAVLDANFQAMQGTRGGERACTMVPRRVSRLWISASGIGHEGSTREVVYSRTTLPTRRTAIASISVFFAQRAARCPW
jgi:hypothetical protein